MGKNSKKKHTGNSALEAIERSGKEGNSCSAELTKKDYEREMDRLQVELVKLQDWVKATKARIVILFEGRDAAGKGGVIRRLTERVSPRVFRVVAMPAPTEREKSQIYWQRYIEHLPSGGEVVIFDRSWYNRAGVEHVMGFCNKEQYQKFLQGCPQVEASLISDGITLLKYWLEVSEKEQHRRFQARIKDPSKRWKLSPMDLESHRRWYDYSRARDAMLAATDTATGSLVHRSLRRQKTRPAQLHCRRAEPDTVRGTSLYAAQAAGTSEAEGLRRAEAATSARGSAVVKNSG